MPLAMAQAGSKPHPGRQTGGKQNYRTGSQESEGGGGVLMGSVLMDDSRGRGQDGSRRKQDQAKGKDKTHREAK